MCDVTLRVAGPEWVRGVAALHQARRRLLQGPRHHPAGEVSQSRILYVYQVNQQVT